MHYTHLACQLYMVHQQVIRPLVTGGMRVCVCVRA